MKRGTIVLTPFPFTDLSGRKVSPAVVVSSQDLPGADVVLAFITSRVTSLLPETDLLIEETHADFAETGLKVGSAVRCGKLVTIDTSIILGELGELPSDLISQLNDCLRYALGL